MELYSVSIGNLPLPIGKGKKTADTLLRILKKTEGLYGIHPNYPYGTILFYKTLNQAKRARNQLQGNVSPIGDNICRFELGPDGVPEFKEKM